MNLSLCIIVKNERKTLDTCLSSVRDVVGEMIVVDTGSNDGTQQIAAKYGARVLEIPWTGDFSAARNAGLSEARGRWILVLDADESLSPVGAAQLKALASVPADCAYRLTQVGADASGQQIRMEIVRLFPNRSDVRFQFPIHEQVDPSLMRLGIPIRPSPIEIIHTGYDSPEKASAKRMHYRSIIEDALARSPEPATELHLRYLSAVNYLEDKKWLLAGEEFGRCVASSPSKTMNLYHFARLRAAECFMLAGSYENALRFLPEAPLPGTHPALLFFRGQIEAATGNKGGAKIWYAAVAQAEDRLHNPPVDLQALKAHARHSLANMTGC